MTPILIFLKSPLGRSLLAGLGVLVLLSGIYLKGRGDGSAGEKRAEASRTAHAVVKAAKVTTTLAQTAEKAGTSASAEQQRIIYRTQTVIERIPYEVPASADPVLGVGFVRSYSASLGLPDDPALAGVPADRAYLRASEALGGIETNNGACLAYRDAYQRVVSLYDQAQEAVNGFRP